MTILLKQAKSMSLTYKVNQTKNVVSKKGKSMTIPGLTKDENKLYSKVKTLNGLNEWFN